MNYHIVRGDERIKLQMCYVLLNHGEIVKHDLAANGTSVALSVIAGGKVHLGYVLHVLLRSGPKVTT